MQRRSLLELQELFKTELFEFFGGDIIGSDSHPLEARSSSMRRRRRGRGRRRRGQRRRRRKKYMTCVHRYRPLL